MSILTAKYFHDEQAAYDYVEAHVWPTGRVCPHCGEVDNSGALKGNSTRMGLYKCYGCRKPFTVKIGTIFESSHVKMHLWLQAIFLMASSKKGISANQLHRTLGVTLKTAWFMEHRIREAMKPSSKVPMGSSGGAVEADETFFGRKTGMTAKAAYHHKMKVLTLIDRESKQSRSIVLDRLTAETIQPILRENIAPEARLMTDEAAHYRKIGREFASHEVVNHGVHEYARGDVTTNRAESFFSVFKRGMKGTYQHCDEKHLNRYLAEFDFRYNNRSALGVDDATRAANALKGISGKRLKYRTAH